MNKKIGFIGLGIMGESMSENLVKKSGMDVYVYDLNKSQVEKLVAQGAIECKSSEDIAKVCDYIFTMVPTGKHVKAVYEELIQNAKEGTVFIDMSTIEPSTSIEVAERVAAAGCIMLDAPVVKSKPAAVNGTLGIYVGGNEEKFKEIEPLLKCMGANIKYLGRNGNGLVMKICHNMLVAQIQNGVNEMLLLAEKAGIDLNAAVECISYGGGQNFYLDGKSEGIINNDFTTAFSVENMNKDINIAVNLGKELRVDLQGAKVSREVYDEAMKNYSKEDFSATYKAVKTLRGDRNEGNN